MTVRTLALFAPCYVDQLYPRVAIAALEVLERLGFTVVVPGGAACCGQPLANAGFQRAGDDALASYVEAVRGCDRVVVLSGSCTVHVCAHAPSLGAQGRDAAERTVEFCAFLHDEVGLDAVAALGAAFPRRVAVHVGCHGLRGLGLARPSEIRQPHYDKVRALLATVGGISFAQLSREDECCGFGGTFAITEQAVSSRMGRDRIADIEAAGGEVMVSTDMSCLMHLEGIARASGVPIGSLHVAEVLAGRAAGPAP